MEKTNQEPVKF